MEGKFKESLLFSTRHSEHFEEVYSKDEASINYEGVLKKSKDIENVPYSKIESNIGSKSRLKEKGWEFSFNTNLRFLDQNRPVYFPEKKGFNLADYLLSGKYNSDDLQFFTEIGDVQVSETENTVQGLARRGGKFSLQYKDLKLNAFTVKSEQVFGFRGGTGIDLDPDDQIMGLSGKIGLFSNRASFKTIYVEGGEEEGSYLGTWLEPARKKGKALGFVFSSDLLEQRLTTEAEFDLSRYDPDSSDEFSSENDKAYKFRLGGSSSNYSYDAIYEYMGPDYEVIGNQGLSKDQQGFMLTMGANLPIHSANLSLSRYNDNVENDDLYPRVYTYEGTLNYSFNKFPSLPMGLSYQKSILDSSREPEYTSPVEMDTDTISGIMNYTKGPWNFGLQASHSRKDDRTSEGDDTTTTTYIFTPTYTSQHISISPNFSFNSSKYELTGTRTDTYTVNLDLRGDVFKERITYEFGSTYNRIKASDDTTRQDSFDTNFRLAYYPAGRVFWFSDPSIAIRGRYSWMDDKAYDEEDDDFELLIVFSTNLPFSF
jgi:hypothetical protein